MQSKHLKKENILTIPNLLSLIRILLIPFVIWLYARTIRDIPVSPTVKNLTSLTSNSTSNGTTHMGTYNRL